MKAAIIILGTLLSAIAVVGSALVFAHLAHQLRAGPGLGRTRGEVTRYAVDLCAVTAVGVVAVLAFVTAVEAA